MEEMLPTLAVSYKQGKLIYDESVLPTCVDFAGYELVSEPKKSKLPPVPVANDRVPRDNANLMTVADCHEISKGNSFSSTIVASGNCLIAADPNNDRSTDNNLISPTDEILGNMTCSNSLVDEDKKVGVSQTLRKSYSCDLAKELVNESELVSDLVSTGMNIVVTGAEDYKRKLSPSHHVSSHEIKISRPNALCFDSVPLWGITTIQGKRPEMEDTAIALPRFLRIPSQMLMDAPVSHALSQTLTAHLYGVYDGHGGSQQVAKYCHERLHMALAQEIDIMKKDSNNGSINWKEQWSKAFLNCFCRVDDEVGGFSSETDEPDLAAIAPEAVGSTAVVAVVSPTHIIVANCGDSRAVLCRAKLPMPLSVDHKPNREDECTRIEELGGKVINWDGHRVSGVLAVSRSIGDRYLRPYVIPDPEMMFVPRVKEDDCLILASDGLWDVLTNEEACDVARRRILLWHKKNGGTLTNERGVNVDPAAQDAAEYLTRLALQRGSRDNISVIVVDLKAQRKFKKKT
ncbi:protein phosphatase 2C 77-like isoform X1 [Lycium barbarum]|uniref:protein phosphatase 2C 77-like isoform X1 n=2 Tax=Lycium barbarum TaxID=112863 RepID=UPI00293EA93B|nr:protein phosphatase 2C 77-like isoform X1 [Lycium barbarum]XP_060186914.1 protein phosphatase 2C 77-like isoform X1 [Lycium barbarum]XP_060186915.1 protein phosphatase 2C 77-like isoform X1 [Lycium barbarum]